MSLHKWNWLRSLFHVIVSVNASKSRLGHLLCSDTKKEWMVLFGHWPDDPRFHSWLARSCPKSVHQPQQQRMHTSKNRSSHEVRQCRNNRNHQGNVLLLEPRSQIQFLQPHIQTQFVAVKPPNDDAADRRPQYNVVLLDTACDQVAAWWKKIDVVEKYFSWI